MKAVNLIPPDERRGAGSPAKSGVAVYALLAVLALAVLMLGTVSIANRAVSENRDKLAKVEADASSTEARAGELKSYTTFAAMREKRQETVAAIAAGRIDWSGSMREIARTLPSDSWLTSVRATTTPSAAVAGGATDPMRSKLAQPAVELAGCTATQSTAARVVASMRRMNNVQRVSISSAKRPVQGAAGGDSAGADTGCGKRTTFSLTVFYKAKAAPAATAPAVTPGSTTAATSAPASTDTTSTGVAK